eukprot:763310-Hanusia_phi.AAC.6
MAGTGDGFSGGKFTMSMLGGRHAFESSELGPNLIPDGRGGYGGRTFNRNEKTSNASPLPSAAGTAITGGAASRRPASASAVRISATRQSAVGQVRKSLSCTCFLCFAPTRSMLGLLTLLQLRGATLASSHAPVLAFSKAQDKNKVLRATQRTVLMSIYHQNAASSRDSDKNQDQSSSQGQGSAGNAASKSSRGSDEEFLGSAWLIKYLNEPSAPPPLDSTHRNILHEIPENLSATNVISILISSQFLKMQKLVDLCLQFVCRNANEILKMPIDLNCLNQELLTKVGLLVVEQELDLSCSSALISRLRSSKSGTTAGTSC